MGATLAPETILRQLSELWMSLGQQGKAESGAGVLRASTMTLMVLADESDDPAALGETIAALMPEHPARAIVVRLNGNGGRKLEARVFSQCWMPFGQRRQICCEQIEIAASFDALADLAPVVLPLSEPDLPLIVWCRSPRLFASPELQLIAAPAQKLVLDSSRQPEPGAALQSLAGQVGAGGKPIVADLAWTRLTRWREMLAQVFENRKHVTALGGIARVRIGLNAELETAAWYMAAWIVNAVKGAGATPQVEVARSGESPLTVELSGEGMEVRLSREQDRLVALVNGLSSCMNLPRPSDYLLLREELSILRQDPVWEQSLAAANRLMETA